MTTSSPIAELCGLLIGYDRALLPPIDVNIARGEFLGIVGPNGGGKSTLVKTLCGVLAPLAGEVRFPGGRARIAYVPQRDALDPAFPLSALQVVTLALTGKLSLFQRPGKSHREHALAALARLGMDSQAQVPYRALSGGQKQRVLLARALVTGPELLALDEPASGLDLPSSDAIREILRELHQAGTTIVLVSHDLASVCADAGRVALIDHAHGLWHVSGSGQASEAELRAHVYASHGGSRG